MFLVSVFSINGFAQVRKPERGALEKLIKSTYSVEEKLQNYEVHVEKKYLMLENGENMTKINFAIAKQSLEIHYQAVESNKIIASSFGSVPLCKLRYTSIQEYCKMSYAKIAILKKAVKSLRYKKRSSKKEIKSLNGKVKKLNKMIRNLSSVLIRPFSTKDAKEKIVQLSQYELERKLYKDMIVNIREDIQNYKGKIKANMDAVNARHEAIIKKIGL
jgi:hypothetical protein